MEPYRVVARANYNFLIWGGILLCCLLVEKLFLLRLLDKSRVIGHLYVLFVVPLSWVAFAVTDLSELGVYMTRLFPLRGMRQESSIIWII